MDSRSDRFLELEASGASSAEIAGILGVSTRTVTRWRHDAGCSHAPAADVRDMSVRERARRLLDDGASFADAAATVGVARSTLRRWFPDVPAWTRSQTGQWSVLLRQGEAVLHG